MLPQCRIYSQRCVPWLGVIAVILRRCARPRYGGCRCGGAALGEGRAPPCRGCRCCCRVRWGRQAGRRWLVNHAGHFSVLAVRIDCYAPVFPYSSLMLIQGPERRPSGVKRRLRFDNAGVFVIARITGAVAAVKKPPPVAPSGGLRSARRGRRAPPEAGALTWRWPPSGPSGRLPRRPSGPAPRCPA